MQGAAFDQADADGVTPLSIAVRAGNLACASVLVAAGANALWVDKRSNTLLHAYLSNTSARVTSGTLVRHLVAWGTDVNAVNAAGDTAFTIAAESRNRVGVCALFAAGAKLIMRTRFETVEELIAAAGHVNVFVPSTKIRIQLVRARGAEVCIGLQPLHLDALQLCEIVAFACAPAVRRGVPFHELWNIAVKVKHFTRAME